MHSLTPGPSAASNITSEVIAGRASGAYNLPRSRLFPATEVLAMSLVRLYLSAQLAAFSGFVILGYAAPVRFASALGITLSDVTARADFSATYGGMSAGVAVVLALGATRSAWQRPALALAVAASAGLFVGRLLALAQLGPAGAYIYGSMAIELVAALAGLWLLRDAEAAAPSLRTA